MVLDPDVIRPPEASFPGTVFGDADYQGGFIMEMTDNQFSTLIDKIDHLDQRMTKLERDLGERMTRIDQRMGVLTGVFVGGIILILTAAGIYTNVILAVQNLN